MQAIHHHRFWHSLQTRRRKETQYQQRRVRLVSDASLAERRLLNMYMRLRLINTGEDSTVLGFAYFPTEYREKPELDGIYIRSDGLPGGSSRLRQGGTAIHETGHWLGLLHTFEVRFSLSVIAKLLRLYIHSTFRVGASAKAMGLLIPLPNSKRLERENVPLAKIHVLEGVWIQFVRAVIQRIYNV